MDFEPMYPGFESLESNGYFFFFFFFRGGGGGYIFFMVFFVIIITVQICKFNITVYSVSSTLLLLMMPRPSALWFLNYALYAYNTMCMVQLPYVCYMDLNFALSNSLTTRDANS